MQRHLIVFEEQISGWPDVSVHSHRFGGKEFRFRDAEIGHIHIGGIVDIPFPLSVHDALLADGLAERHHWVPNSGWTTFRIQGEQDLAHALWLMRLSYLRYALKTAADPRQLLEQESEQLRLSPRFKSLLVPFVPLPSFLNAEVQNKVQAYSEDPPQIPPNSLFHKILPASD